MRGGDLHGSVVRKHNCVISFPLKPLSNLQKESFRKKKITIAIKLHPIFTFCYRNYDFPNMQPIHKQQLDSHFVCTVSVLLPFITAITMTEISEVAGKYREKNETKERESCHLIELQMVHPHQKTPKIKNLLIRESNRRGQGEEASRTLCVSGRKQLFSLKSR